MKLPEHRVDKGLVLGVGIASALMVYVIVRFGLFGGVHELLDKGGAPMALVLLASPVFVMGMSVRSIIQARNYLIELRNRLSEQRAASELAKRDSLTGLLNRRGMLEEIEHLASSARLCDKAVALMVLDLDHFKMVNDVHGHPVGDDLIRDVAERLRNCCASEVLVSRLGGDEFALALDFEPGFEIVPGALAEAVVEALSRVFKIGGLPVHIGASIGISACVGGDFALPRMLREADVAMYRAKQDGRNCVRWFDCSMEAELRERSEIEAEMRKSLGNGEFVPFYEPQIDLATGGICGFEVLARWLHPVHGMIMPDKFISIAEETGMIADLSFQIISQAMEDARDWDHEIAISVNVSPVQLRDATFAQKLLKLFVERRFQPHRLEVEITESALLSDLDAAQSAILSLKNQGVRVALDDFGTGYSSLHHLRAIPFDRIKIDRSFTASIVDNSDSAAIVDAVLSLGRSMGIDVIAEGVETAAIEDLLCERACPKGQGWLYSKPVTREGAEDLLEANDAALRRLGRPAQAA